MYSALLFYLSVYCTGTSVYITAIMPPYHFGPVQELLKLSKIYNKLDEQIQSFEVSTQNYPSIENLHEYLQAFQHCFVYIQNYQGIEMPSIKVPIVLSEIEAVFWTDITSGYYTEEYIHVVQKRAQKTYFQNGKLKTVVDFNCTSDFFIKESKIPNYIGHCLGINRTKFITNSRPWNCEVHFDVFAPPLLQVFKDEHKLRVSLHAFNTPIDLWVYKINTSNPITRQSFHSPMYFIKVRINMFHDQEMSFNNPENLNTWFFHSYSKQKPVLGIDGWRTIPEMVNEIYITMFTNPTNSKTKCNITKVVALKPCYICREEDKPPSLATEISRSVWKANELSRWQVISNFFPTRGEMVSVRVEDTYGVPDFRTCRNFKTIQNIVNGKYEDSKFDLALIQTIQQILGNYSYSHDWVSACENEVVLEQSKFSRFFFRFNSHQRLEHYKNALITLSDDNNIFTFVSCGKPPSRGFAFEELINVFDMKIWLFIFASVLLITFVIVELGEMTHCRLRPRKICKLESQTSIVVQAIKVFLEQGGPFESLVVRKEILRFSIGAFLLVGIVLSNAYKSSNVYNLVSPRKPIPYENLSQLISDGFKIYSRGEYTNEEGLEHKYDSQHYIRSLNYTQFMEVSTIGRQPFHQINSKWYTDSYNESTYFSFGPAILAVHVGITIVSEVSMFLLNLHRGRDHFNRYFSQVELKYNITNEASQSIG